MKKRLQFSQFIENKVLKFKKKSGKILEKFQKKFNKGNVVATHHFNNASPELVGIVRSELEEAGFRPELIGNKPDGHILLRVSLLKSVRKVA
ncbi:MAG: hypothetical protein JEZ01_09020 [Labilibaculum sp.]|nr:hypothetical protein [Labilibaculum sp.]MBI9057904.1 hypothetical protein [Labilibaculum sp.]